MAQIKTGIFGGTFNPLHMGHLNSALTVIDKLDLKYVHLVPAHQNPHRQPIQGPSPEMRFKMVSQGIEGYEGFLKVEDLEVQRGGLSYTIETIHQLKEQFPEEELHLIIGSDQFEAFDHWKDYDQIIGEVNLIVTSRPGGQWPYFKSELPPGVKPFIQEMDAEMALLNTGKVIYFVKLNDVDVSSTEVRKKIRNRQPLQGLVPKPVEDFITQNELYESLSKRISDYRNFTLFCAGVLDSKGGLNTVAFDLSQFTYPSEFTIVSSGTSTKHASSLADHLIDKVYDEFGVWPHNIEGKRDGRWIVADYGSLIIHVFYDFARQSYRLEELWGKAETIFPVSSESVKMGTSN